MRASAFDANALLAWYRANQRAMPWRGHPSPYAVWVSEIMLQQTQVDTVRPFFARFMNGTRRARLPATQSRLRVLSAGERVRSPPQGRPE